MNEVYIFKITKDRRNDTPIITAAIKWLGKNGGKVYCQGNFNIKSQVRLPANVSINGGNFIMTKQE